MFEMYFWFWVVQVAILGLIIGSFLNVYIYRFHTGKSLSGRSHCLSCAKSLRWYELFPVISYLALRGRCLGCRSKIPSRYFWVELTTASLFVLVGLTSNLVVWPLLLFLCAVLVVITVYDIYHMIIPDSLVATLIGIAVIHQVVMWYLDSLSLNEVAWSLLSGVIGFCFFAGLWWYSSGRWLGFGDAKLAFPLGVLVGLSGTFSLLVLAFWVGTLVSLILIGYQYFINRGQSHLRFVSSRLTMKSEVPFAPFLIVGFLLVYFLGVDVLALVSYAI